MLAGIYIPHKMPGTRAFDRLEADYLRRAFRALRSAAKDTRFVFFSESDTPPFSADIPIERIRRRDSMFRRISRDKPALEQALALRNADVLLTTVDAPVGRITLPKVLFTLDMMIYDGNAAPEGRLHPTLPRLVKRNCADSKFILCPSAHVQKSCSAQMEIGLEKTVLARAGVEEAFGVPRASIIEGPFTLFPLNRYTCRHIKTITEALRRNKGLFPPTPVSYTHLTLPTKRIV